MIGDDIVDLKLARIQSNWRRKGWLQKIFAESEQEMICNSEDPDGLIWKLWSMKEATYKAHQRRFSIPRKYNPWAFVCSDEQVTINNYSYNTVSKHTDKYAYTISYTDQSNFISKVFTDNSLRYKRVLQNYVADVIGVKESSISIHKDINGIPSIKINKEAVDIPLSFSSHGSFSAFTIDLP
ncbi:4'-phosphopantetheinyl transferase superfamily protein [Aquimarina amphilecti]|uniref:4'-phosphopantetheinyl transferase superfamily protein n=1 Tax=Aquimarina amphilecti TaxID=1038014 RepID=A0A1H7H2R5_AQUAM|nr:4'-phosphopantetheinyl transferase superfamily protein [Aquimarina amphilecti]SEK44589.1 4'-phosphopantetheinyl transferase superfamily protein [Aquimarina amphilecti]